jgi:ComF family protein
VILDAVFPRYCVNCAGEGTLLCSQCMADLSFDGPPFAYANPVIRQLICAWKYDGDIEGLRTLAALLRSRLEPLRLEVRSLKVEGIVPVPLSEWKERWRGFHQARDLARVIGEALRIPVIDVLEREHRWIAQANLSKKARRESLKKGKVMGVKAGHGVPGRILIIDDVETTGATMNAAEEALKEAGAETVVRWSLARG